MIDRLHHVGVVVRDADAALGVFRDLLGLKVIADAVVEDQGVRSVVLAVGEHELELVQPIRDDTGVARYLEQRGERVHHYCFRTDDIQADLDRLAGMGIRLIDRQPRDSRTGRSAFIHPKSMQGVLIELTQPASGEARSEGLGLHHLATLTGDYPAALDLWTETLGLELTREMPQPERQMVRGFVDAGHCFIEIIGATDPESRFYRRLERDREGPVSTIAFEVYDVAAAVARFRAAGVEVPDPTETNSGSRVLFGNEGTCGVYIQLIQPGAEEQA